MKISILGAGAIGSMVGGWLQLASPEDDVLLIGLGEHVTGIHWLSRRRQPDPYWTGAVR